MINRVLTCSVVICTLNRPDDIQRCFMSIARQTRKPLQAIVVDAGDLGAVEETLCTLCTAAGIEFIYRRDTPSTTKQRNHGARYVTSDIVFFLDDDVELDSEYIDTVLRCYEHDTNQTLAGVAGVLDAERPANSSFWRFYAKLFLLAETRRDVGTQLKPSNFPIYAAALTQARGCDVLPSTAVSYRKDIFLSHLFDTELTGYVMAEDIDLSYRVSRQYRLLLEPAATFRHRKSATSRNSAREHEKRRILFTQYFFQKNLGNIWWHHIARYWALVGLIGRYLYRGIRYREIQNFYGLWDGLIAAKRNRLLGFRKFAGGPLEY